MLCNRQHKIDPSDDVERGSCGVNIVVVLLDALGAEEVELAGIINM